MLSVEEIIVLGVQQAICANQRIEVRSTSGSFEGSQSYTKDMDNRRCGR